MTYRAPLDDMRFTMRHIADLKALSGLEGLAAADPEVVDQALGEAGKLAEEVLAPLNRQGDMQGARLENGVVRTPDGFADAYAQYRDGGWNAVPFDPEFGGMGLPWLVGVACEEMWNAANMGFALCPLLNQGAVEAIQHWGDGEQKRIYLPRLISGEWTGTMNLTEPQAGSDVGALRSRAEPRPDGSWRIFGQKIFITYGDHDFAENIVHLVLARTPDGPPGTRGISLFIVPKRLPDADGRPGERNDLRCVSLEHKLGIHASPTAVMSYGDHDGAVGWMLGPEHGGMRAMFTMMNNARLAVGVQGLAIAERAYQQAVAYATERRQGKALQSRESGPSAIVEHADVRRMLMTMKAGVDAMRALCYVNAEALDLARRHADPEARRRYEGLAALLTPVSKAWCTDMGVELASLGVQVHGGMGFIEEAGAAQHYRDARILPIYEGTNGIQAMDFVMRKLGLEGGATARRLLDDIRGLDDGLAAAGAAFAPMRANLAAAVQALDRATEWMLAALEARPNAAAAGATPFLKAWGLTLGAWLLGRGALAASRMLAAGTGERGFLERRVATARFFAEQMLPAAGALAVAAVAGDELLYAVPAEHLAA